MPQISAVDGTPASSLCFGAMQFGGTADADASCAMYAACRDAGVTFFDTAYGYTEGASETLLGGFAKVDRDSLTIATKVGYTGGSGAANIRQTFDTSRRRLDMEMVDILYLHRFDPDTPLEETFEALATLQNSGAIRYIGVSNFAAWQVMKAQAVAAQYGTRIDIMQPMYSLVKRQAEVELFPMALSENIAMAPYSPLGGGLLTGKYIQGGTGRLVSDPRYAQRYGQDWMHDTAADFYAYAAQIGQSAATLAVAWAAHHAAVTAPIISARSVDQLKPSLQAADLRLTAEQYAHIAALSLTPAPATDRLDEA